MKNDPAGSRVGASALAGVQPVRDPGRVTITASPADQADRLSGWRAILALPLLRRSVILSEIIGPPRGLKAWGE